MSRDYVPEWDGPRPAQPKPLTHDEIVAAAYVQGVKDGAERAAQWVANELGIERVYECDRWVLKLLPASREDMIARGVPLTKVFFA